MFQRQVRWSAASFAAVVALCFTPAWSKADTQILVEEVNGSGTVISGTAQIFASSTTITTSLANFSSVNINVISFPSIPGASSSSFSSLTTIVNASPVLTGFDPTIGIRVIVTTDGFTQPYPGGTGVVTNDPSVSSSLSSGQTMLTANTQLLNDPLTTPTSSSSSQAAGGVLGSATGLASAIGPNGPAPTETSSTVSPMPGSFALQQTIDVVAINASSNAQGTLGGSLSSGVTTSPVPAPGGLALALIGLPLLGLGRALRKRATL